MDTARLRQPTFVLTLACPDRPGLVHAVTSWLMEELGNILDSQQFDDSLGQKFFMRVHFETGTELAALRESFEPVAGRLNMEWSMQPTDIPYRTLVMVSKQGHCLNDLLFRQSAGSLNIEIPAIVSNHREFERLAHSYDVPFHHIPVDRESKAESEARLVELVDELDIDLVVLARYMQILSDDVCRRLAGRAINIHHSFLPSFKGARPYHQAHARGVKLTGATAHYVTPELDEGPIIEQGVTRVNHRMTPEETIRTGREIEAQVLSRAVQWHTEQRLIIADARVVVFP